MIISLVGMPGSGKTTLGKLLAENHKIPFFDLDQMIENRNHKSITLLFSELGEEKFRQLETELLKLFFANEKTGILALGGGTPCFFDNMEVINRNSESYYLNTPIQIIAERLFQEKNKRPLIAHLQTKEDLTNWISYTLLQREKYYQQAKNTLVYPFEITDIKK
jgi:shikimate kinase